MSEHERVFEELPLAAAGALDASEERTLRAHLAGCEICSRELQELQRLTAEMRALGTPTAPAAAVERVRRLVHLELASRADEKIDRMVLVFLLLFSWTVTISGFLVVRLFTAGTANVLRLVTEASLPTMAAYFGTAWLGGAAMLVVIGLRYRREREGRA